MAGRPTKYDPSYCEAVIDFCRGGFSLTAFAGSICVDRDSITEWRSKHPEFDHACRVSKAVRTLTLETTMMDEDIAAPAMNARKLALANCAEEDWREPKQVLEHSGRDGAPIQTQSTVALGDLTDEQLRVLASIKVGS